MLAVRVRTVAHEKESTTSVVCTLAGPFYLACLRVSCDVRIIQQRLVIQQRVPYAKQGVHSHDAYACVSKWMPAT